jgi:hypothetical protein
MPMPPSGARRASPPRRSASPPPGLHPFAGTGSIAIADPGIDLDDLPPATDPSSFTVWNDGGQLQSGTGVTFAAWNGAAKPGYSQCHDWVLTHGVTQLQLTTGLNMCVLTAGGRTAYVTITSLSGSNTTTAGAKATVWNLPGG